MLPYIDIIGVCISTYGICLATAFLLCLLLFSQEVKKMNCNFEHATVIATLIAGSALLGAYLLHQVVSVLANEVASSETSFVLFGGIVAGIFCTFPVCRIFNLNAWDVLDRIASIIPIGQAIGRIGCFCVGCCYGLPTDSLFHVVYSNPEARAPQNIPLIPVQIYEALFDVMLFSVLFVFFKKKKAKHLTSSIYLFCYVSFRFFIEFFRGDAVRGFFLNLSTSQWISLLFLPFAFYLLNRMKRNKVQSE